jgi:hypothetical protein
MQLGLPDKGQEHSAIENVQTYRHEVTGCKKPPNEEVHNLCSAPYIIVGRYSSVGTVTRYTPSDSGIESRWGRDYPYTSRPALESTQPPIQWVPGHFIGGKAAGAWRSPSTPSSVKVKERVELYLGDIVPLCILYQ